MSGGPTHGVSPPFSFWTWTLFVDVRGPPSQSFSPGIVSATVALLPSSNIVFSAPGGVLHGPYSTVSRTPGTSPSSSPIPLFLGVDSLGMGDPIALIPGSDSLGMPGPIALFPGGFSLGMPGPIPSFLGGYSLGMSGPVPGAGSPVQRPSSGFFCPELCEFIEDVGVGGIRRGGPFVVVTIVTVIVVGVIVVGVIVLVVVV